jgi:DNA-binding response OmpR family regulator
MTDERILLVEDETQIAPVIAPTFAAAGFQVTHALNAAEA